MLQEAQQTADATGFRPKLSQPPTGTQNSDHLPLNKTERDKLARAQAEAHALARAWRWYRSPYAKTKYAHGTLDPDIWTEPHIKQIRTNLTQSSTNTQAWTWKKLGDKLQTACK